MSPWFHGHVEDGRFVACETTDGRLVHMRVGRTFTGPRQVVDFTEMRNRHVSPLRSPAEPSDPSLPDGSAGQPRGSLSGSGDLTT